MTTLQILRPSPHVAEVWLDRPEVRNAFDERVIAELTEAFAALGADAELRAIVLGGRGKAFCAGADLGWMRRMAGYSWDENRADAARLAEMLWTVWRCPVPVVGRVHGDCYAGGVGLAAVCDVLVAADGVQFCLSEARLGLLPATIAPYVVRALGEQAARRFFVTAERFSAARAAALGFVHECVPADALDATVGSIVASLVANGPAAVKSCKRLVQDVAGREIDSELRAETARRIADIRAGDEGREGVAAFLGKREPAWRPSPASRTAAAVDASSPPAVQAAPSRRPGRAAGADAPLDPSGPASPPARSPCAGGEETPGGRSPGAA